MNKRGQGAQRFYDRWARLYDLVARETPGIKGLRSRTAAALSLEPGDTVVEMGCGTGANLGFLRERVGPEGTVIGLDFTRGVLDRARDHVDRKGWENVHLVRADATRPPLLESVDAVLATFVVGMLSDPSGAVEDWCELVGPGGNVGLLNLARSRRWYGPIVNGPFRVLVVISTPSKRRLATGATELLDRRVKAAHGVIRDRCVEIVDEERGFGLLRLSAGRVS